MFDAMRGGSADAAEDVMSFEDDCDTIPGNDGASNSELLEAIEWLRGQGFLNGEARPFSSLLKEVE